jgi:transcriptional regulator with XRE-family HTH domain
MFNNDAFTGFIKAKRGQRSLRDFARETGISASTLSRIENGQKPDIETFFALCDWAGINPGGFNRVRFEDWRVTDPLEDWSYGD